MRCDNPVTGEDQNFVLCNGTFVQHKILPKHISYKKQALITIVKILHTKFFGPSLSLDDLKKKKIIKV